jgi:hypothetical protein
MQEKKIDEIEKAVQETALEVHGIKIKLERLEKLVESFVTRPEFDPIKMLVYGMAGSILMTVLGAILARVIAK